MAKKDNKKSTKVEQPVLVKALFTDIFVRHWFVTLLAIFLVFSAIQLTQTTHKARSFTAELQIEKKRQRELQIQWESLRLEFTTLTEADRISSEAKKQLQMEEVTLKNEKVISL